MRTELVTVPGHPERPNEDWISVALPSSGQGGTAVVLDGVTPPPDDDGCVHTVDWFTARLGGALTELSGSRRDLSLAEILSLAIRRTADSHRDTCDLSHVRTPQATVVMARWDRDSVEHLVLSDSALLLASPEGTVRAVLDGRLDLVPREILRSRVATDALRNTEGGFFTAAADPSVARRAVTGVTPRADVRAFAALTDGASRWVELFQAGDWAACFRLLEKEGPRGLVERVRAIESADRTAGGARRWKLHDDATALYVEL
ncbi:hypothetical protein ACH44C_18645 [Streptomyces purpureus]|uniref:hypothetical protein n=1 Tax=Streptomyces purpureus TaxID=1951 RepID=UPI0037968CE9